MEVTPIWISLKTAVIATIFTTMFGVFVAYLVMKVRYGKVVFDSIFTLPMVLPPTVTGFLLLVIFGKNSVIGRFFTNIGFPIVFSFWGCVLSAFVCSFPLVYRGARGAFEQMDQELIGIGKTLGLSEAKIFFRIVIPNCKGGILASVMLAFARSMGEFGATIMVAGNIPGKTQTMATAIYTAVQSGNRDIVYVWVGIMVSIAFLGILLMNIYEGRCNKKNGKERGFF